MNSDDRSGKIEKTKKLLQRPLFRVRMEKPLSDSISSSVGSQVQPQVWS